MDQKVYGVEMYQNVYEMNPAELLKQFEAEVTGRSGFHILFRESLLRGAILARLEGRKPPFCQGDKVRPVNGNICTPGQQQINSGTIKEVAWVYYEGNGKWTLSLKDDEILPCGVISNPGGRHQAEEFELANT